MYWRLLLLSMIVLAALCGVTCLGYHAVNKWAQGLEGARLGEFAEVAEQIRQDVKRKLDEFIQAEQERPYTDYLQYYVPETVTPSQQQLPVVRSPLAEQPVNGLAYGYFQIEPGGNITAPWYRPDQPDSPPEHYERQAQVHFDNVWTNILPAVTSSEGLASRPTEVDKNLLRDAETRMARADREDTPAPAGTRPAAKQRASRKGSYPIESLQAERAPTKVVTQQRAIVALNTAQSALAEQELPSDLSVVQREQQALSPTHKARSARPSSAGVGQVADEYARQQPRPQASAEQRASQADSFAFGYQVQQQLNEAPDLSDTVQIRIEPFVPMVVPEPNGVRSLFGRQVFLLRHVQIEEEHFIQGFQLGEKELIAEVEESAGRFVRENMTFELDGRAAGAAAPTGAAEVAYTASLDFGFGELLLHLKELDPAWIGRETGILQRWYFSTVVVVSVAVGLALAGLWKTTRAQIKLARKKDEFISAVSHELRTPLTSIRMYAEMLENNWLTSKEKTAEYYRNLRQESERLSRLIENVLDFSRLQRGRKRYDFRLGDVNQCISEVVAMMRPYAGQHGFSIETDLADVGQCSFDRDAVAQIVVNLLDNAVKYARSAVDKTICVRTRRDDGYTIIEVEDHGPGVPHRQRTKIFEQFYRGSSETPARDSDTPAYQTTGTGLGLALVKRFAEAHHGFVEILSADPGRTVFRVGLAMQA